MKAMAVPVLEVTTAENMKGTDLEKANNASSTGMEVGILHCKNVISRVVHPTLIPSIFIILHFLCIVPKSPFPYNIKTIYNY